MVSLPSWSDSSLSDSRIGHSEAGSFPSHHETNRFNARCIACSSSDGEGGATSIPGSSWRLATHHSFLESVPEVQPKRIRLWGTTYERETRLMFGSGPCCSAEVCALS